jgi:hypothetical protein
VTADSSVIVSILLRQPGFVQEAELAILPFIADHWPVAVDAFAEFGKGRHAAGLNFGDCLDLCDRPDCRTTPALPRRRLPTD